MMKLSISVLCSLAVFLTPITAQWIYPPPLPVGKSLNDYTSGTAELIRSYLTHDMLIGGFRTPESAFHITRCARVGHTSPILPSTESFNSSKGRVTADGTWQIMDGWIDWYGANRYSRGKNIFVVASFEYLANATMGSMCWLELYSVSERQVQTPFDAEGYSKVVPEVTLLGEETDNYFASIPFIVDTTTIRPGNRNITWRSGGENATPTTIVVGNRPTTNSAPTTVVPDMDDHGFLTVVLAIFGVIVSCLL